MPVSFPLYSIPLVQGDRSRFERENVPLSVPLFCMFHEEGKNTVPHPEEFSVTARSSFSPPSLSPPCFRHLCGKFFAARKPPGFSFHSSSPVLAFRINFKNPRGILDESQSRLIATSERSEIKREEAFLYRVFDDFTPLIRDTFHIYTCNNINHANVCANVKGKNRGGGSWRNWKLAGE